MSAQGGTLQRRGTIELPIWPVAVLVVAAVAGAIALSTLGRDVAVVVPDADARVTTPLAVNPGMWTLPRAEAFIEARVTFPRGLEHAGAYPAAVSTTVPVGLENPGAYGISQITEATYPRGLENPAAYPAEAGASAEGGIMVNGELCVQCR